jgi:DNA (cytosine-5)-methyltransferase 1
MHAERPIAVDLFAGAGGMSLGFEQAGFEIAAAVEIDPVHAATHKFNFPECSVLPKSVIGLSAEQIRAEAGLQNQRIDVVFGGAPCQGFSLIGHRALDDPRNTLVREFVRIVTDLHATYFVFENVKGLTVGRHKSFLGELIEAFRNSGYELQSPWQVLNASHYAVPQDRERLILLGARRGHPLPEYPERISIPAGSDRKSSNLPFGPSCHDALGDLPDAEEFLDLIESDTARPDHWDQPSAYARKLRCLDNDAWFLGYPRRWDPTVLSSSMRTDHSRISRRRFSETAQGDVEPISRFYKLSADGVSNTLRAGTDSARGAFTSPRPIHYELPRCVTVREMARLHGFPDWFRFHMTKWHGARQVGNAVPPPLARAVASEISKALGISPKAPNRTLDFGDEALLRMDMSRAAEFWRIPALIGRRDRKSGAKKRKQHEIEAVLAAQRAGAIYA